MNIFFAMLSALNFLSAFAFSVKFMFVTPNLPSVYYGLTAWIMAFGFAMLTKFTQK